MSLKKNLPEQATIYYVDKHKRSHVALYNFKGTIHIVDEINEDAEVYRINLAGLSRTGLKTRDIVLDKAYVRCGLGTTLALTQE